MTMENAVSPALVAEDAGLVLELLAEAQRAADAGASTSVQRAIEAVVATLTQGHQSLALNGPTPAACISDAPAAPSGAPQPAAAASTIADLSAQVAAAVQRVASLRKGVTQQVAEAVAAQAEALRPALQTADMTLAAVSTTPGKADRRRSMDVDAVPPTAALHLGENLHEAVDKLPALKARIEEVSKRMSNVLRALEEQRACGRSAPTPLRTITPAKRAAESDSVVGVIARATCR